MIRDSYSEQDLWMTLLFSASNKIFYFKHEATGWPVYRMTVAWFQTLTWFRHLFAIHTQFLQLHNYIESKGRFYGESRGRATRVKRSQDKLSPTLRWTFTQLHPQLYELSCTDEWMKKKQTANTVIACSHWGFVDRQIGQTKIFVDRQCRPDNFTQNTSLHTARW